MNAMKTIVMTLFVFALLIALAGCSKKVTQTSPATGDAYPASRESIGAKSEAEEAATSATSTMESDVTSTLASALVFEDIHFEFDRYDLSSAAMGILADHARILKENPRIRLKIEGHCDERGTIEYNLALGDKRANIVKNYMVNYGIDQSRLSTISYGKERPLDQRSNEEAWAKNRRAAFLIVE